MSDDAPEVQISASLCSVVVTSYTGGRDEQGRYSGSGSAVFLDGNTYEGDFARGMMHGKGVYTWPQQSMQYTGEFSENCITGTGAYNWADGSVYSGGVKNGLRHGSGTFTSANGDLCYEGAWQCGKRHGTGTQWYDALHKSHYTGEWSENDRCGKGLMLYTSGNSYNGHWSDDVRCGHGVMVWKQAKERYDGSWLNGKQHGYGVHTWLEEPPTSLAAATAAQRQLCNTYKGDWSEGFRHGSGQFLYANGSQYNGSWVRNQKHGRAVFIYEDGHLFEGEFREDRMVPLTDPRNSSTCSSAAAQASEVSTVPAAVTLRVGDLLDGASVEARQLQLLEVNRAILQANSELKTAFRAHSRGAVAAAAVTAAGVTDTASSSTFAMTCTQLLAYLGAIHALAPLTYVSEVDVYRALYRMRRQHALELQDRNRYETAVTVTDSTAADETASKKLFVYDVEDPDELFDCTRAILYREFVEILVRVAVFRYMTDPRPVTQTSSTGSSPNTIATTAAAAGSSEALNNSIVLFPQAVKRFLNEHVLAYAATAVPASSSSSSSSSSSTSSSYRNDGFNNKLSRPPVQPSHLKAVAAAEAAVTEAKPLIKRLFRHACAYEGAAQGHFAAALRISTVVRYLRDAGLLLRAGSNTVTSTVTSAVTPAVTSSVVDVRTLLKLMTTAVPAIAGSPSSSESLYMCEVYAGEITCEQLVPLLVAIAAHLKAAQEADVAARQRAESDVTADVSKDSSTAPRVASLVDLVQLLLQSSGCEPRAKTLAVEHVLAAANPEAAMQAQQ